ncbi:MAG: glycosyltransferase family 87 protein [Candidatus Sulfotelmatobacter sp.]
MPLPHVQPRPQFVLLFAAVLAAASMWFYVDQILVAYQRADAAAHQRPRGNLSDLYPRWLGTRELLLHHRNPYADDITTEIQKGYYGRALDPNLPSDPKDQEGFAYPVYVVFLLAPLVAVPFPLLQTAFYWFLALLTAASVGLWLRALRWRLAPMDVATAILITLGSFSVVQGIKLQQLSLLVAGLLAASMAATVSGSLFFAGALLALATIKPQLAWPSVAWLLVWAVSDWRARRKLVLGFALVIAVLFGGAEIILPGWWRMFAGAVAKYRHYTQSQSVIEVMLNQVLGSTASGTVGRIGAQLIAAIAVLACGLMFWRLRANRADTEEFGSGTALVLAVTVLVVPMYAPYNQLLLLPAVLLLVRDRRFFTSRSLPLRFGYVAGIFALTWQWIASAILSAIYLLGASGWALSRWQWPFFATFALPVLVFVLIFLEVQDKQRAQTQVHRLEPPLEGRSDFHLSSSRPDGQK